MKMDNDLLNVLKEQAIEEHTLMIISKNKNQLNEVAEYIKDEKNSSDVYVEISLKEWNDKVGKAGVNYKENFDKIMDELIKELSKHTTKPAETDQNNVAFNIISLLEEIVRDRMCYIVIKDFEVMNTIFPESEVEYNSRRFYPLEQFYYLSPKFNKSKAKTLYNTAVILLSEIGIKAVDNYKFKTITSEWEYCEVDIDEVL